MNIIRAHKKDVTIGKSYLDFPEVPLDISTVGVVDSSHLLHDPPNKTIRQVLHSDTTHSTCRCQCQNSDTDYRAELQALHTDD